MMPARHHLLSSLAGLMCGFFLESDSLSLLNVNLKVDVDGITVIDQSYPVSKLIRLVLSILYRSRNTFIAEVAYNCLFFRITEETTQVDGIGRGTCLLCFHRLQHNKACQMSRYMWYL